jgi:pyruvate formate lyase activating enzyme
MAVKGFIFNIQKFSLHDGPGIRTVVFFSGCPLSCHWCSNPQKSASVDSQAFTLEGIMPVVLQDRPFYEETGGGVTLSGGEALAQPDFAAAFLRELRKEKINTAVETSGFAPAEVFTEVSGLTDFLLFDIKHYDEKRHVEGTGVDNALILSNLKSALDSRAVVLPRIPVIPGYNNSADDAGGFARLLGGMGINRVQLLPFHQLGEKKYEFLNLPYRMKGVPQLHPEDLGGYRQVFVDSGIDCFF